MTDSLSKHLREDLYRQIFSVGKQRVDLHETGLTCM